MFYVSFFSRKTQKTFSTNCTEDSSIDGLDRKRLNPSHRLSNKSRCEHRHDTLSKVEGWDAVAAFDDIVRLRQLVVFNLRVHGVHQ